MHMRRGECMYGAKKLDTKYFWRNSVAAKLMLRVNDGKEQTYYLQWMEKPETVPHQTQ